MQCWQAARNVSTRLRLSLSIIIPYHTKDMTHINRELSRFILTINLSDWRSLLPAPQHLLLNTFKGPVLCFYSFSSLHFNAINKCFIKMWLKKSSKAHCHGFISFSYIQGSFCFTSVQSCAAWFRNQYKPTMTPGVHRGSASYFQFILM